MSLLDIFRFRADPADRYETVFSTAILKKPVRIKTAASASAAGTGGRIEKGVLLLNQPDVFCEEIPNLKDFFYLVERNGWTGMNRGRTADVKLIENLEMLEQTHKDFPIAILLEFANADFVDTDIFRPLDGSAAGKNTEKEFTGIQISAWEKFKRHDLFVQAAALLPEKKFIKFGHFWKQKPDRPDTAGIEVKKETIALSKKLGADIYYPFEESTTIISCRWIPHP
jgi:hypothetical protein